MKNEMLDRFVKLNREFNEIYEAFPFCGIDISYVHLRNNDFNNFFSDYSVKDVDNVFIQKTAYYDGVEFICLERKAYEEV